MRQQDSTYNREAQRHKEEQSRSVQASTLQLMSSIFLILFAFFVVMNRLSNQVVARAAASMDSISVSFRKAERSEDRKETAFRREEAKARGGDKFGDFQNLIRGIAPGSPLRHRAGSGFASIAMELPADSLFPAGSSTIRYDRSAVAGTFVKVVRDSRPGERRVLELLFGAGNEPFSSKSPSSRQLLAIARAATMGQALQASGAPPFSVRTGLRPGHAETILVHLTAYPMNREKDGEGAP